VAEPGHLKILVRSPFREQSGDAVQVRIQGSARVGQMAGPAGQQELPDFRPFRLHATGYLTKGIVTIGVCVTAETDSLAAATIPR
jgi:hypothetical protein